MHAKAEQYKKYFNCEKEIKTNDSMCCIVVRKRYTMK